MASVLQQAAMIANIQKLVILSIVDILVFALRSAPVIRGTTIKPKLSIRAGSANVAVDATSEKQGLSRSKQTPCIYLSS